MLDPGHSVPTRSGDHLSLQAEQVTGVSQDQGRLGEPYGFRAAGT